MLPAAGLGAAVTRARRVAAAALLTALATHGPAAADQPFVLGPGDKLSVQVFKRPDLSGEFRVLPTGDLSLPFVRSLPVAGHPLDEARAAIAARFRDDAFLLDPRVNVDLIEVRPVYVSGEVRKPGTFAFQPGMTVLHAISAAGGVRTLELEDLAGRLEVGRLRERLRQGQEAIGLALIRRARALAERGDRDDFPVPDGVAEVLTDAKAAEAVGQESDLLRQRNLTFRSQLNVLGSQVAVYREEIQALTDQNASKAREGDLVVEESRYLDNLIRQGLSPRTARVNELQRLVVQVEGERRGILAQVARAKQEIARLEQTLMTLTNQRQVDITTTVKDASDTVSQQRMAAEEVRTSLMEARETLPSLGKPVQGRAAPEYTILRTRGGQSVKISAPGDAALQPGDLVDVPRR